MNPLTAHVIGFLTATLGGATAAWVLVKLMWDFLYLRHGKDHPDLVRYQSQPAIVGLIERSLYYGAFLMGQASFIAIWLTLKTVAKSPRWTNEEKDNKDKNPDRLKVPGRAIFQPFIAGNGISILYAAGGYEFANLLVNGQDTALISPFAVGAALFLVTVFSIIFAYGGLIIEKKHKNPKKRT